MIKQITPEKALERLETLCARAEHCSGELRRKLRMWRITPDDADAIIYSLTRRRFVDDARFARVFVRDKYRFNRWGRIKLRMELRTRGVADSIIDEAFEEIDDDIYYQALFAVIKAKARSMKEEDDFTWRRKLYMAAAARGYEGEVIAAALRKFDEMQANTDE